MDDLQNIKNQIEQIDLPEDSKGMILDIIAQASSRGSITEEEKKKVLEILELEIDRADLEADTREEVAEALESFVSDIDSATKTAEDRLKEIDQEAQEETTKIKDDLLSSVDQ